MVKVHITLSEADLAELDRLARQAGVPKSQLVREAVSAYVAENRRQALQAAMRRHAEKLGDASGEFVAETDTHVTQRLLRETKW
jgi:metal-responsive CopG/Arc/MetJ family transcriptional regulator